MGAADSDDAWFAFHYASLGAIYGFTPKEMTEIMGPKKPSWEVLSDQYWNLLSPGVQLKVDPKAYGPGLLEQLNKAALAGLQWNMDLAASVAKAHQMITAPLPFLTSGAYSMSAHAPPEQLTKSGHNVIAIGVNGGHIIGYGHGVHGLVPIYENQSEHQKLNQAKEHAASGNEGSLLEALGMWFAALGLPKPAVHHEGTPHHEQNAFVALSAETAVALGVVPHVHASNLKPGSHVSIHLPMLMQHVGKPITPPEGALLEHAAEVAAGEVGDKDPFPPLHTLKKQASAGKYAGSHQPPNQLWLDPQGREFVFKPGQEKSGKENLAIARSEEAASRLGMLILGEGAVPHARVVQLGSVTGVLIKVVPGTALGKESAGNGNEDKIIAHAPQLAAHAVLDWLIANHDGHGENFLEHNGKVTGIDKGQAWKWIGGGEKDQLDGKSFPNNSKPVSIQLWEILKAGKLPNAQIIDAVVKALDAADKISLPQFRSIIAPQIASKVAAFKASPKDLEDKMVARKQTLRKDFTKLLSSLLGTPVDLSSKTSVQAAQPVVPKGLEAVAAVLAKPAVSAPSSVVIGPDTLAIDVAVKEAKAAQAQAVATGAFVVTATQGEKLASPATQAVPGGWPVTHKGVTVHHPGGAVPVGVKWPAKYPGPGYHATIKYSGKTFEIQALAGHASGPLAIQVKFPDGQTKVYESWAYAASNFMAFNKGLSLDLSQAEHKKLGVAVGGPNLLQLDHFGPLLVGAGAVPQSAVEAPTKAAAAPPPPASPEAQASPSALKAPPGASNWSWFDGKVYPKAQITMATLQSAHIGTKIGIGTKSFTKQGVMHSAPMWIDDENKFKHANESISALVGQSPHGIALVDPLEPKAAVPPAPLPPVGLVTDPGQMSAPVQLEVLKQKQYGAAGPGKPKSGTVVHLGKGVVVIFGPGGPLLMQSSSGVFSDLKSQPTLNEALAHVPASLKEPLSSPPAGPVVVATAAPSPSTHLELPKDPNPSAGPLPSFTKITKVFNGEKYELVQEPDGTFTVTSPESFPQWGKKAASLSGAAQLVIDKEGAGSHVQAGNGWGFWGTAADVQKPKVQGPAAEGIQLDAPPGWMSNWGWFDGKVYNKTDITQAKLDAAPIGTHVGYQIMGIVKDFVKESNDEGGWTLEETGSAVGAFSIANAMKSGNTSPQVAYVEPAVKAPQAQAAAKDVDLWKVSKEQLSQLPPGTSLTWWADDVVMLATKVLAPSGDVGWNVMPEGGIEGVDEILSSPASLLNMMKQDGDEAHPVTITEPAPKPIEVPAKSSAEAAGLMAPSDLAKLPVGTVLTWKIGGALYTATRTEATGIGAWKLFDGYDASNYSHSDLLDALAHGTDVKITPGPAWPTPPAPVSQAAKVLEVVETPPPGPAKKKVHDTGSIPLSVGEGPAHANVKTAFELMQTHAKQLKANLPIASQPWWMPGPGKWLEVPSPTGPVAVAVVAYGTFTTTAKFTSVNLKTGAVADGNLDHLVSVHGISIHDLLQYSEAEAGLVQPKSAAPAAKTIAVPFADAFARLPEAKADPKLKIKPSTKGNGFFLCHDKKAGAASETSAKILADLLAKYGIKPAKSIGSNYLGAFVSLSAAEAATLVQVPAPPEAEKAPDAYPSAPYAEPPAVPNAGSLEKTTVLLAGPLMPLDGPAPKPWTPDPSFDPLAFVMTPEAPAFLSTDELEASAGGVTVKTADGTLFSKIGGNGYMASNWMAHASTSYTGPASLTPSSLAGKQPVFASLDAPSVAKTHEGPKKIPKNWKETTIRDKLNTLPLGSIVTLSADPTKKFAVVAPPWSMSSGYESVALAEIGTGKIHKLFAFAGSNKDLGIVYHEAQAGSPLVQGAKASIAHIQAPAIKVPKPQVAVYTAPPDPLKAAKKAWATEHASVSPQEGQHLGVWLAGQGLGEVYARKQGESVFLGDGTEETAQKLAQASPIGGASVVATPWGPMAQMDLSVIVDASPSAGMITGPDGAQYPHGTTFVPTEIPAPSIKAAVPSIVSGWNKLDDYKGADKKFDQVLKWSAGSNPEAKLAEINALKTKLDLSGPVIKGGANIILPVTHAELAKPSGPPTIKVEANKPPELPQLKIKTLTGLASSPPPPSALAENNRADLASAHDAIPAHHGYAIRMGGGGVLLDGQVIVHKLIMPGGQKITRVTGQLITPPEKLDPSIKFTFHSAYGQWDPATGTHTMNADNIWTSPGSSGSSGRVLASGAKAYVFTGSGETMRRTFTVDVLEGVNIEQATSEAMTAMGADAAEVLRPLTLDDEHLLKKTLAVRAAVGPTGMQTLTNLGLAKVSPAQRHAKLDAVLHAQGLNPATVITWPLKTSVGGKQTLEMMDIEKRLGPGKAVAALSHGVALEGILRFFTQEGALGLQHVLMNGNAPNVDADHSGSGKQHDLQIGGSSGKYFVAIGSGNQAHTAVGGSKPKLLLKPTALRRSDWYAHAGDSWGSQQETGLKRSEIGAGGGSNEVSMASVSPDDYAGVLVQNASDKNQVIAHLKKLGHADWKGVPLDQFVIVAPSAQPTLSVLSQFALLKGV